MQRIRFFRYFPLSFPSSVCFAIMQSALCFWEPPSLLELLYTVSGLGIDPNFPLKNLKSAYPICAAFPFPSPSPSDMAAFWKASSSLHLTSHVLLGRIRSRVSLTHFSFCFWKTEFLFRLKTHHQMHWLKLTDTSTDVYWSVIIANNSYLLDIATWQAPC